MPQIVADTEEELWEFALIESIRKVLGNKNWVYCPHNPCLIISEEHPSYHKILKELEDVE